jgi:PAS domain S-box-containing protein
MDLRRVAIWIIGEDGRTVYANAEMGDILLKVPAEMVGESVFVYVFPEDLDAAKRLFQSKKTDTTSSHFRLCRTDGAPVWVDLQGTPMHDAGGRYAGIIGMCTRTEP